MSLEDKISTSYYWSWIIFKISVSLHLWGFTLNGMKEPFSYYYFNIFFYLCISKSNSYSIFSKNNCTSLVTFLLWISFDLINLKIINFKIKINIYLFIFLFTFILNFLIIFLLILKYYLYHILHYLTNNSLDILILKE